MSDSGTPASSPSSSPGPPPSLLRALLEVQAHDVALAQLLHRRSRLPEHEELSGVQRQVEGITREIVEPQRRRDDLARQQAALEADAEALAAKGGEAEKRLYSGSVSSPRELQALEADIASLKRQRAAAEDRALELLIEREPLDASIDEAALALGQLGERADALGAAIAAAQARIDEEAADHRRQRAELAAAIPPELLARYDGVRARNNGIGAARLEHGTCMSCRLKLSAVDIDRIRTLPADSVVQCEECGAILVR